MKKLIRISTRVMTVAMLVMSITPASWAADPQAVVAIKVLLSGISHSALFGLDFDGNRGVAVGADGLICESEDAGVSWKTIPQSETPLGLLAVSRRGTHTIAVGQMGAALVEDASGAWKKYDTGTDSRLLSVGVNASGLAFAGGEFGTVIKSTDGGHTWSSKPPDWSSMAVAETFGTGEPTIYSVDVSEAGVVTIAGEFGAMMRSEDGGASWKAIRPIRAEAPAIFAMQIVPKTEGSSYAVGQSGEILVSSDGGLSWSAHSIKAGANLLGVTGLKNGRVVATGMRVMSQSLDSGNSWHEVQDEDAATEWYQTVRALPTANRILAVGHGGRIIEIGN